MQMQVLAAYVTDPGWRPTGWDRLRALSGTIHDQLASTPGGVFGRDAGILLHGGDRRWATPTREQMAASSIADARAVLDRPLAARADRGDHRRRHRRRRRRSAQTAATFGALPPRAAAPAPAARIRFPAGTAEPVRLTHRGRADQGLAFIAWPTAGFFDDPRQARTLSLLSSVFQLRLIQKIREEQGTTYSPQAAHNASEAFAGYGMFTGRIEARPEALAGFLRDAEAIAADLRDRPIEADELERARRRWSRAIQRQRNGNGWWLDNLERIQTEPRVAATIAEPDRRLCGDDPGRPAAGRPRLPAAEPGLEADRRARARRAGALIIAGAPAPEKRSAKACRSRSRSWAPRCRRRRDPGRAGTGARAPRCPVRRCRRPPLRPCAGRP